MRIVHLTPGTGSFHCGSCLRDNALVKALRARGHDAEIIPLYLPLVTDDQPASPGIDVQVGGINLYLQERFPMLARALPAPVRRFLDGRSRLRAASRWAGMTSARDLGRMTLGSLDAEQGNQRREWQRLIDWIGHSSEGPPDVLSLSNSLLAGLVPLIHRQLSCPVLISLQGEDAFLDSLTEPYREKCWSMLGRLVAQADCLVAPSHSYARDMTDRLGLEKGQIRVVPNGLAWQGYTPSGAGPARHSATIGYLGRMIEGKGLGNLIDAFLLLHRRGKIPGLQLHLAGASTRSDRAYLETLRKRIAEAGAAGQVRWLPNIDFEAKIAFLHTITVFSMPAPSSYGEAFGLSVIEAIACGAPAVQPDHGAYPEIIGQTGGGLVVAPDDPGALAAGLEQLLLDAELRHQLAARGAEVVRRCFSEVAAAQAFEEVAQGCLASFGS